MNLPRFFCAHFGAVFIASGMLLCGFGYLEAGFVGAVERLMGWMGGFVIFAGIALVSAPIGIGLRWLLGHFDGNPLLIALVAGMLVGLALMPTLHPQVLPALWNETSHLSIALVHALSGIGGGAIWWLIERPYLERQAV